MTKSFQETVCDAFEKFSGYFRIQEPQRGEFSRVLIEALEKEGFQVYHGISRIVPYSSRGIGAIGKPSASKTEVTGSSPGAPATLKPPMECLGGVKESTKLEPIGAKPVKSTEQLKAEAKADAEKAIRDFFKLIGFKVSA